jgi:hypothetical protein
MRLNNWSIAASYETARIFAGLGFGSSTCCRLSLGTEMRRREFITLIAAPRQLGRLLARAAAGEKPLGPSVASDESILNVIRWRAFSRNRHER